MLPLLRHVPAALADNLASGQRRSYGGYVRLFPELLQGPFRSRMDARIWFFPVQTQQLVEIADSCASLNCVAAANSPRPKMSARRMESSFSTISRCQSDSLSAPYEGRRSSR